MAHVSTFIAPSFIIRSAHDETTRRQLAAFDWFGITNPLCCPRIAVTLLSALFTNTVDTIAEYVLPFDPIVTRNHGQENVSGTVVSYSTSNVFTCMSLTRGSYVFIYYGGNAPKTILDIYNASDRDTYEHHTNDLFSVALYVSPVSVMRPTVNTKVLPIATRFTRALLLSDWSCTVPKTLAKRVITTVGLGSMQISCIDKESLDREVQCLVTVMQKWRDTHAIDTLCIAFTIDVPVVGCSYTDVSIIMKTRLALCGLQPVFGSDVPIMTDDIRNTFSICGYVVTDITAERWQVSARPMCHKSHRSRIMVLDAHRVSV